MQTSQTQTISPVRSNSCLAATNPTQLTNIPSLNWARLFFISDRYRKNIGLAELDTFLRYFLAKKQY